MMATNLLYIDSDNLLTLDKLKDAATDAFLNAAAVTVTLKTEAGVDVTGQVWPTTMSYIAASDGKYQAVLDDSLDLTEYDEYIAEITADNGSDAISKWFFPLQAVKQRS